MNFVKNMATLKGMQKKGLIKFTEQTGCKINKHTIYYVDDLCEGVSSVFEYNGNKFCLEYVSGCFYPYVMYYSNN